MPLPSLTGETQRLSRRSKWLTHLHQWHWISSALSLLGIVVFSITGITLNHAGNIEAKPTVTRYEKRLPNAVYASLTEQQQITDEITAWIKNELAIDISHRQPEWSNHELYFSLPRPGGDAWLRIDLQEQIIEYELTDRGWIAYLNDLHKGRHTGAIWRWFIDALALACLIFAFTGLLILKAHAARRPGTWPTTGLGIVIPLLLILLFIH